MPIKSKAQNRLFQMVAHDKEAAKRTGIPQSVAKEYIEATPKEKFKHLKERLRKKK